MALSCCARAPRRAMPIAAMAYARLASRISPSGIRLTTAAVEVETASDTDVRFAWSA